MKFTKEEIKKHEEELIKAVSDNAYFFEKYIVFNLTHILRMEERNDRITDIMSDK